MKQIYLSIRISLFIILISSSQNSLAQCSTIYNQNGTNVATASTGSLWGQGFIAECDGSLEYVQFISNSTGTVSAGTLNIYNGNTVAGTPSYTQTYPSITINNVGEPIRVNIDNPLTLTQNSQYTFELTVDNRVDVLADFSNGYSGGTVFEDGSEFASVDFIFEVSISSTLSVDDINENEKVKLFPNPSSNFIQISGISERIKFKIINVLGAEIKNGIASNNKKIDIRDFTNGLYFLKFENGNTIKFLKE